MKKKILILGLVAALTLALFGCAKDEAKSGGTIAVGSKNFTENIIIAHMMADLVEAHTDLKVDKKVNLGGSNVAWTALESNDIQMYPDYTGTIVANYYQEETGKSEETLAKTKELTAGDKLKALEPIGFNNTYTLAVTQETAAKYNLNTYSDLAKVANDLIMGCEFEFIDRPDGYPGLQKVYNLNFKEVKGMDHGIMFRALNEDEVDVIDAYTTDGQIKVFDLKVLQDDKEFFPPYDILPLVRQDTLDKYPEIEGILNKLAGKIDEKTMQELNALVDDQGMKEEVVAHDFLVKAGLIEK
ncbi:periplasmic glycine betaine/choline-binding (lipo)protein of an ABC-type transport system (osmoprotectant binding protein) [Desulfitobacterium dichloroeliminans LMG P-21439]|uniref:Periplasmic glycine betaine/choline-binding (Lipo)protein of an ABC-type transport system (Osmoprotectant binding protein) n=1 Tax=Desulfitobacterium dichloroeliminans (strain LMG P-21439 / DCA1) TaxID=871963 RepID=L0F8J3_DESDL|nr:glycine betaine ABC transporter substrate-binding protein [Desulfitobacterium dichloroeliminans]AGA68976.1 periplasmic glycine betaine/choline-binding (lipo)protein of an ABC-type transport system (osmoprotectant binding protein) [Desulfitobacterium dichloroeliminans LMG P-21439]